MVWLILYMYKMFIEIVNIDNVVIFILHQYFSDAFVNVVKLMKTAVKSNLKMCIIMLL